ncbi:hypothetical protein ACIQJW_26725 [Streptomyces californicus]|uniref:hypothetical protein n=1 Tax=Streptomyces californicus TaxID=67351 RepID=UPI00380E05AC
MPTSPTPADRPADLLRAAAEKLRKEAARAHRASPAPWAVTDERVVRCADGMTVADRSETDHPAERGDLLYIALMHPGVGLALAAWLDRAAVEYDATVRGAAGVWSDSGEERERDAWVERQTNQHALAVARQLLGTRTDEGPDELRAELAKLIRWHKEDGNQLTKMRGTIERLRAERTELIRQRDQIAMDTIKALPAPADRAAVLHEAAEAVLGIIGTEARLPQTISGVYRAADHLRRLAGEAAAGVQPPTTTEARSPRRRLTPTEHDRAWHAIEGSAGEPGADPDTILNAVLYALRIDAPTAAEEQAASPSRRATPPAAPAAPEEPTR